MPTRIDKLTPEQEARFDEWADRWIEIGLRTGPADRERFEEAARECYRHAGIEWPGVVVWVPSPVVLAFAAPAAAFAIELVERGDSAVREAVRGAVREAVDGAVGRAVDEAVRGAVSGAGDGAVREAVGEAVSGAVRGAVRGAVGRAVGRAVDEAVRGAVREAVDGAVGRAVDEAVSGAVRGAGDGAVREAVGEAVDEAVRGAVREAVNEAVGEAVSGAVRGAGLRTIEQSWYRIIGGQLWVGGWYWGGAWASFFREVCALKIDGDIWDRARAYEATMESACWWWPHRRFVMVSERPLHVHTEISDPNRPRGWGSHRLHCETGPAVVWPDGWGVYSWHGVQVPADVILQPDALTAEQILGEENVEVRRVMVERAGYGRLLEKADRVQQDDYGTLWRIDQPDDEPLQLVQVADPSTGREYFLRVPPVAGTAREAVAWTFDVPADEYEPAVQT